MPTGYVEDSWGWDGCAAILAVPRKTADTRP